MKLFFSENCEMVIGRFEHSTIFLSPIKAKVPLKRWINKFEKEIVSGLKRNVGKIFGTCTFVAPRVNLLTCSKSLNQFLHLLLSSPHLTFGPLRCGQPYSKRECFLILPPLTKLGMARSIIKASCGVTAQVIFSWWNIFCSEEPEALDWFHSSN